MESVKPKRKYVRKPKVVKTAYRTPGVNPQQRKVLLSTASDLAMGVAGQRDKINARFVLHMSGMVLGILPTPEIVPMVHHARRDA